MRVVFPMLSVAADTLASRFYQFQMISTEPLSSNGSGGDELEQGSEAYFEERIAGKLQLKTVQSTEIAPNRYIEFKLTSWLVELLLTSISFRSTLTRAVVT